MKKVLFATLAAVFALASFTACDKDDNKGKGNGGRDKGTKVEIPGNVEDADDVVKVAAVYKKEGAIDIAASATLADGKFIVMLPETVADSKLSLDDMENLPEGVTADATDVKTVRVDFIGMDADDEQLGKYFIEGDNIYANYLYSNKAVKVTGESELENGDIMVYDLDLKKGWNLVFEMDEDEDDVTTTTITNTKPGNIAWLFDLAEPVVE